MLPTMNDGQLNNNMTLAEHFLRPKALYNSEESMHRANTPKQIKGTGFHVKHGKIHAHT